MPRFSPYTQCHTYTASTSFQPRWWLKNPTWAAGKYTRGIMKAQLMVARMVPKNRPLSQCGTDPVVAHPGPVPVDAPTRRATSLSINRRVTLLARGKDGATRHDHPP